MKRSAMMRCAPGTITHTSLATVPEQRRTAPLRFALHRIRDTAFPSPFTLNIALLRTILASKDASRPKSEIDLGGVRCAVPRALARRHRPDRGLDRAADHGRRARRPELSLLGGDGLSAHQHGRGPAVRKIRRPVRPQDRPAG